jgi:hypothetical protein
MTFYEIKANGRYYDEVFYASPKKVSEVKTEFQKLLKTEDIKVRIVRK